MYYNSVYTTSQRRMMMYDFEAFVNSSLDLSGGERLAIYYVDILGYTSVEAAERLNQLPQSIRNQLNRGREKINKQNNI